MKKTLFDHFVADAKHHACCAKANKADEENFAQMAELAKAAGQDGIATACTALSKSRGEVYKSHLERGEALAELLSTKKTLDDDELNKMMPSEISGIAPPNDGKSLHRAVSRAGAPTIEDKTATIEFSKIFGEN